MTQTSQTDEFTSNVHSMSGCGDDLDHLEVLSLCEGTTDEYDIIEDDYLSDDRKLDKSIDTTSSCTKSSSAERDDDSDIVALRNRTNENRAPIAFSLPHESHRLHAASLPIHYSDKSLNGSHTTKSESGSSSSGGSNMMNRTQHGPRRPFALHLNHEPFHNILELPSPSSASLHSGHGHITMQELTTKSNSAPILLKNERKRDDFIGQPIVSIIFIPFLLVTKVKLIFPFNPVFLSCRFTFFSTTSPSSSCSSSSCECPIYDIIILKCRNHLRW